MSLTFIIMILVYTLDTFKFCVLILFLSSLQKNCSDFKVPDNLMCCIRVQKLNLVMVINEVILINHLILFWFYLLLWLLFFNFIIVVVINLSTENVNGGPHVTRLFIYAFVAPPSFFYHLRMWICFFCCGVELIVLDRFSFTKEKMD